MGKPSGGGSQTVTQLPWGQSRQFGRQTIAEAQRLANKDKLVAKPFQSGMTKDYIGALGALGQDNPFTAQTMENYSDFMGANTSVGGPALNGNLGPTQFAQGPGPVQFGGNLGPTQFAQGPSGPSLNGNLGPTQFRGDLGPVQLSGDQFGMDRISDFVMSKTLPQVAGMFGQGGFANSTMAQQTAADAVTNALTPFAQQQFNLDRGRMDENAYYNAGLGERQQGRNDQQQVFNTGLAQYNMDRNDANAWARTGLGERNVDRLNQQQVFNTDLARFGLQRNDANSVYNSQLGERNVDRTNDQQVFNTNLALQNMQRNDQNAWAQTALQGQNIDRDLSRTLSGLGLAPTISGMQYADLQALGQAGGMRDAFVMANRNNQGDNVRAATDLFTALGGMGGSQTSTGGGPGTLETLGGIGQLGVNAGIAGSLLGLGGLGGAGGAFGAGTFAAGPALAGLSSLGPLAAFCDRRLKTDIEPTPYRTPKTGSALYTFRYLWDEPDVRRIGPMAQEVPAHARVTLPSGFLAVDMGAL